MSTRTTTTTCRLCTGPYLVRRGEDIALCARHWNAWLDRYVLDPDAPDAPDAAHLIAQEVTRAQTAGGPGGDGPEARDCEACNGTGIGVGRLPDGRWAETDCSTCDSSGVARDDATVQGRTEVEWGVRYVLPWWPEPLFSQHPTREEAERRFEEMTSEFAPRVTATLVQRDVTITATPWREVEDGEDHA